jgi:hypothetical protein
VAALDAALREQIESIIIIIHLNCSDILPQTACQTAGNASSSIVAMATSSLHTDLTTTKNPHPFYTNSGYS